MPKITLAQFAKKLRSYRGKLEAAQREGIYRGAQECLPMLQQKSQAAGVDTGGFAAGWRVVRRGKGVRIINIRPGSGFIDNGRAPGKAPPPDVILGWVQRRFGQTGAQARSTAFLIGRKIAQRGLVGKRILRSSRKQMRMIVRRAVKSALIDTWRRA